MVIEENIIYNNILEVKISRKSNDDYKTNQQL